MYAYGNKQSINQPIRVHVTVALEGISGELQYIKRCFTVSRQFTVGASRVKIIRSGTLSRFEYTVASILVEIVALRLNIIYSINIATIEF